MLDFGFDTKNKKTKNCLLPGDTVLFFLFTVYFMTRVANSSRRAAAWFRRTWCRCPVHPSITTAAPSHTHSNRDWSLAAGPTRTSTHIRKIFLTIHYRGLFTNFFFCFHSGPSEDVALRLARNLKLELGSTYTLSETGWAGPTGSSGNDSSVGTVFFAIVSPTTQTSVRKVLDNVDPEDRSGNMVRFAKLALEFLLEVLLDKAE